MTGRSRLRVAITGAGGTVGRAIERHLATRYDLVPMVRASNSSTSVVADVRHLDSLVGPFLGAAAVVHLAAAASVLAGWDDVLATNINGTYNVFEAARRAGVQRVVYASTNHVVGRFEQVEGPGLYDLNDNRRLDHLAQLEPDSLYGVSKATGELLARHFAYTHGMSIISIRLGSVLPGDEPSHPAALQGPSLLDLSPEQQRRRLRATWLSHQDCARLIVAAIETPIRQATVFGTSDNPRQIWDLDAARRLGYEPVDSAPVELGEPTRDT